ncbi:34a17696-3536-4821-b633-6d4bd4ff81c4 [Sclerotinia trifoliorum]|uniref:34a17696-3536-4821-b633-6d4bd4ff81c4 n=1 Tax=Sclerotinia trifoliorum TaxID=28548 RepID=A0A8H2VLD3_9HELO|nr:34a17696-3536-4821-b633-6d4bd4ff81c4 [Sclerotinia trifoliorum]
MPPTTQSRSSPKPRYPVLPLPSQTRLLTPRTISPRKPNHSNHRHRLGRLDPHPGIISHHLLHLSLQHNRYFSLSLSKNGPNTSPRLRRLFHFRFPHRRRTRSTSRFQIRKIKLSSHRSISTTKSSSKACIGGSGVSGEPMDSPTYKDIKEDEAEFDVKYDKLILAPGCETNTFGTPGVKEHALFMKTVPDARRLREGILDCLERASLPTISEQEKKDILHFAIVGGGPTGIELAAEIDELIQEHLGVVYPRLKDFCTISIYDVADRLLGQFGEELSEYAMEKFENRGCVNIKTGKHIEEIKRHRMLIKEEGEVPFGVVVWAAGNTAGKLVEGLKCRKSEGLPRVLTDKWLGVLAPDSNGAAGQGNGKDIIHNVYALGDAADILNNELPTTAEFAVQKAKWLTRHLLNSALTSHPASEMSKTSFSTLKTPYKTTKPLTPPFQYKQKDLIAYIGRGDGIIQRKPEWTGISAWLAWRSGSLAWTRGWRRRFMVVVNWAGNLVDGREVARR